MNRPTYEVRRMRQGGYEIEGYAVDEQYEGEPAQTVTAGHRTRIDAEASAAALQGAIERFATRTATERAPLQKCSLCGDPLDLNWLEHTSTGDGSWAHNECYSMAAGGV